ncbi:hypothetical protein hmeg3_02395 [Herbaspirillum sp. meg3]|uniref:AAA family ATPase n=1 Tax=Herbaspirillum sp. meg3 TaxID=2025949 RepID=UPI000B98AB37|nr:AAA family ATPase [Herbaspirillum sp. meg3]ASU37258.1 hypothetical protein hmeg3_02395 [Herbaspirillum sp. meg3]
MNTTDLAAQQKFVDYAVGHPHLVKAYDAALAAIRGANNGCQVVIVAGPTGVGKTRMAAGLCTSLKEDYANESGQNPEQIPVLYGNAVAAQGACFSWKDFYTRLLTRSGEPMTDKKLAIDRQQNLFADVTLAHYKQNSTADALRIAAENCLRLRKVRCLIIDEAHHMLMVRKNDMASLEFQFEAIKSLALETQTTIVLVGTYRLLDIRDLSGQLVRRSEIIHFPRYDCRDKDQKLQFAGVLKQFLEELPVKHSLSHVRDFRHFYNKTSGEIGILKDWLVRALNRYYQAKKKPGFDMDFLDRYALDNKALRTIATEALLGENKLADISEDALSQLYMGGLAVIPEEQVKPSAPQKKKGTVGRRSPHRDAVGVANV